MRRWTSVALGVVPLVLLLAAMRSIAPETGDGTGAQQRAFAPAKHFRAVVFILDSAGKSEMFDPGLMPFLSSLQTSSLSGRSRSCAAKATFPCIKSIFEGREATMGTTLQDFSAFPSSRTTWPASLAALGLRLVVASDHTLNRLYPNAFVDSLNYEDLRAPLLELDAFVYRKARHWLDDPSIDVLVLHIIGTDKVAHEYPVRGPEFREKYREVDDFIREVASRLSSEDYLFAISDHGHNELGGHTEDAAYLARGPVFPSGVHQDLNAEDTLFLLSVPYGLLLPADYEGQIRMDLTRLESVEAKEWITEQAKKWSLPVANLPLDQAQACANEEISRRRTEGQQISVRQAAWRSAPFWFAAGLFLIGELRTRPREKTRACFLQIAFFAFGLALVSIGINGAGWIIVAAAFLRCLERLGSWRSGAALIAIAGLGAIAFRLFPAALPWLEDHAHRPVAFIGFYAMAAVIGFFWSPARGSGSWRPVCLDMLWVTAVAVWLLAYFGPLGYSLTRQGSLVVLAIFPIAAVIVAGGWRTLLSRETLLLAGLIPVAWYRVHYFNLKYPLLDGVPELPPALVWLLCALAATFFLLALRSRGWRDRVMALALIVAWFCIGRFFFQFDLSKLIGALFACCWLAGCLELFRRAQLPVRWFAVVSAFFVFVLLTFFLNRFALSHVDFRFAATKIFPFAKELWRAPQLILWAALKYFFALMPALAIIRLSVAGEEVWRQLLLLGWWRELAIVASALGLAIFNLRGLRDLCEEEIYFWTFLNVVFLLSALFLARSSKPSGREGPTPA